MNTVLREALLWQAIAGLVGSSVAGVWLGAALALSLAYGVLLTILNGFFLARHVGRAAADKVNGQRLLYAGAVLRFVGIIVALLLAYRLGLHLLMVAGGMLLTQVVSFTYAVRHASDGYMKTDYKI